MALKRLPSSRRIKIGMLAEAKTHAHDGLRGGAVWHRAVGYVGSLVFRARAVDELASGVDQVADRTKRRLFRVLDVWSKTLPLRVVNEDLGDYAERVHGAVVQGKRALACMLVVAAVVWTGINGIGYRLKAIGDTSQGRPSIDI